MKYKNYHFIGVGGIGMGALASLALDRGLIVAGSDVHENEMVKNIHLKGADVYIGHDAKNITDNIECIVFSSAISENNVEIVEATKRRLPMIRRAEFLAKLMEEHFSITVAGAHGKTTTTSLVSHILDFAKLNPTTAVGGVVLGTNLQAKMGDGRYFIAEADESDGSFLNFSPTYSVITNIDFEHVDYYESLDDVIQTYEKFISQTKNDGCLFVCGDDGCLLNLVKSSNKKYQTFGFEAHNNMIARNINQVGYSSSFDCVLNNENLGNVVLSIPGKHNVCNALAAISVAQTLGVEFEVIKNALEKFGGVKRRFQIKEEVADILVVDDYAHHPSEIGATIDTARNLQRKRIVVAFQPHRYSRLAMFMDDFAESLKDVDVLFITDVYAASEQPIAGVTAEVLVQKIADKFQTDVHYVKREDLVAKLNDRVESGDAVLLLGAGDITTIADDIVMTLKKRQTQRTG